MFKRVERKRKKGEEEEALGLDEETKDILGMHDTDSDESQSDYEDEDQSDNEIDAEDNAESVSAIDDDLTEKVYPPIPLYQALLDPLYQISQEALLTGCLVCPGKILKNDDMLSQHKTSKAHERRFKRFKSLANGVDQDANAWEIVDKLNNEGNILAQPQTSDHAGPEPSKKEARKRKFFENRRIKRKAAAMASKEAAKVKSTTQDGSPSVDPATKKQSAEGKMRTEKVKKVRSSDRDSTKPAKRSQSSTMLHRTKQKKLNPIS